MSMMRERAAEWFETHMPTGRVKPVQKQAYLMALAALRPVSREQVEKVWRGEWLNFYNDFSTAECSRCGELFEVSPSEVPREEYFKAFKDFYPFCPACGGAMTDEAVEMVMERLEALYENRD